MLSRPIVIVRLRSREVRPITGMQPDRRANVVIPERANISRLPMLSPRQPATIIPCVRAVAFGMGYLRLLTPMPTGASESCPISVVIVEHSKRVLKPSLCIQSLSLLYERPQ